MTDVQQTESVVEPVVTEDSASEASFAGATEGSPEAQVLDAGASEGREYAEPTAAQLDQEGDIAADYIEELLDIADIDGDIDIDARNGRSYISVNADENANLRLLSKPDTVTALQELTRLAVQNKTGSFSRLILDIAGSRDARQAELATLVDHAISRIEEGAAQAALPAMSSYERKLVHDIVSERGFVSNSQGEGRDRHTVITKA
ncbi:protein jag [Leifsonia sp. Root227]|uniref:Jag family protein n=1 Tax=Leifsonia sp. Root227 TaxID=1736496 RepID=UPI0009E7E2C9|nr:R3H domain-containing nucleic acid-binding protein [Leifsonia sp. Root227]